MATQWGLVGAVSRLRQLVENAAGSEVPVHITIAGGNLVIERLGLLEGLFEEDPPSREDIESWVVETAQRLGSSETRPKQDGARDGENGRMTISIPVDGLNVRVESWWLAPDDQDESPKRRHLRPV